MNAEEQRERARIPHKEGGDESEEEREHLRASTLRRFAVAKDSQSRGDRAQRHLFHPHTSAYVSIRFAVAKDRQVSEEEVWSTSKRMLTYAEV